jgi:hypothetical protein
MQAKLAKALVLAPDQISICGAKANNVQIIQRIQTAPLHVSASMV